MRKVMIAANWKMNTTPSEAQTLVSQLLPALCDITGVEVLLCPPFISTVLVTELIKNSSVRLGAQNTYFEDKGAFTGEISPVMLAGMCQYVLLGHSERRGLFGESNQIVNRKIKAAVKHALNPVLCVGESLEENDAGRTDDVLGAQLRQSLEGISIAEAQGLVVAYEPIWAIGTGRAASGAQANVTIGMLRSTLAGIFDEATAASVRILYGGSANGANIAEFVSQPEIDGALVGGASLKSDEFISMVKQASTAKG
ncbi:MAG: triose-phosphate isomerase [Dehalococcoidia bacterium]|nr:triose-phosphate isomerase [Dehalococcoidia bacterium]MCL2615214.1 triose-phosphate isomerase [Dehalococcoidia bacterium]